MATARQDRDSEHLLPEEAPHSSVFAPAPAPPPWLAARRALAVAAGGAAVACAALVLFAVSLSGGGRGLAVALPDMEVGVMSAQEPRQATVVSIADTALPEAQTQQLYQSNYRGKGGMWCVGLNALGFDQDAVGGRNSTSFRAPDPEALKGFRDVGVNCFRLPITWERLQSTLGHHDLDLVNGVQDTVQFITGNLSSHVILDPHNNEQGLQFEGQDVTQQDFVSLWRAMAKTWFLNDKVIFGLYREPRNGFAHGRAGYFDPESPDLDGEQVETWRDWTQEAIDAIRQGGSSNLILIPGLHWSSTASWGGGNFWGETLDGRPKAGNSRLASLVDPENNLAYDLHTYMDYKFDGQSTGCEGHDSSFWCKDSAGCKGQDYGLEQAIEWAHLYKKKFLVTEIASFPKDGMEDVCKGKLEAHLRRMRDSGVFLGYTAWQFGCPSCLGDLAPSKNSNLDWYGFEQYNGKCEHFPCLGDNSRHIRWRAHPFKCLAARDGAKNASNLHMVDCKEGDDAQQWMLPKVGERGMIKWATNPHMCVDASGGSLLDGANVQLWKCQESPNLKWVIRDGKDDIRWATHPHKCIDVAGGKPAANNNVQLWDCEKEKQDQQFIFPRADLEEVEEPEEVPTQPDRGEVPAPLYPDHRVSSIGWGSRPSKCLAALEVWDGGQIKLWDCLVNGPTQIFLLPKTEGPIRWKDDPNMCLNVADGQQHNGTPLQLWECVDEGAHPNMQFKVAQPGTMGPVRWATHPEWCVDVPGGRNDNENPIQIWSCGDGAHANMQFTV